MEPITQKTISLAKTLSNDLTMTKAQQQIALKSSSPDKKKAEQAAEQFEAMLALQLVQTMEKSLEHGSLLGGDATGQAFNSFGDWELARILARDAHFGIKEQVLQQINAGNKEK
jgi:Rod binding domain-containing protein